MFSTASKGTILFVQNHVAHHATRPTYRLSINLNKKVFSPIKVLILIQSLDGIQLRIISTMNLILCWDEVMERTGCACNPAVQNLFDNITISKLFPAHSHLQVTYH
eukprot:TRINITY_DN4232_c0_g4_i1.p1 TRINITY_DN4232_c0_g4~~TRINITY_DN4232_c0_g4_i1.p1  ORF type:complete len:106 (+),score=4.99 TRINITY_DN4232_c0_g4_i1:101-418(+)